MIELSPRYNPQENEKKWLKIWKDNNVFHAVPHSSKKPFTVMIPPPNVTGILHMGHALNNTLQDILIRYQRMNHRETLWMVGTDHAGIATQNVVEKQLALEGKRRGDFTREQFLEKLWDWKSTYGNTIILQLERLGSSCDWERNRFTMDDAYCDAVKEAFIRLYRKDLIYQGNRIINWCPRCQTALSDEEADHKEKKGKIYHIRYFFKDNPKKYIVVATTRPETMLGDVAVAVNPNDERYSNVVGSFVILPIIQKEIPIIADDFVSSEFGTGAVKVTPAHDPNDFEIGQRHHLEMINIMFPDGRINDLGGPYVGLDRFQARKQLLADLESQGFLDKVEDHVLSIGHCYRCDTVVEPFLSKQWFVRMKPLAQPSLKAVQDGTLKIRPERFEKVYIHWMEGIRDWCISRQIWWGHRIPVWYDAQGNVFVAHNEQEARDQAKLKHGKEVPLKQDEDVLDTWFSSWLWPFATLGWPKETPELKFFYPTQTLFTASEIIFFWVARMVMAGYEFMGKAPFTDVVIHGTVRDNKGRKMSKSLGNALDPLEIIDELGADALRFSLIINSGQDIYISREKFEIGRNFANKIWNASRLIFMNIDKISIDDQIVLKECDLPSRWIIARLDETIVRTAHHIETFRYSEAETIVQDFFWGDLCDWYLEFIKANFHQPQIQKCALYVLINSLKIIHPFMPFVTEEIYSHFKTKDLCLTLAQWPKVPVDLVDKKAQEQMQIIINVISSIRAVRTQWNVKPSDAIKVTIASESLQQEILLKEYSSDIIRLAKLDTLSFDLNLKSLENTAIGFVGVLKFFLLLEGVVDLDIEKKRMTLELSQKQQAIASLNSRLDNEVFVSKAPQDIILKERERLHVLSKEAHEITQALKSLNK